MRYEVYNCAGICICKNSLPRCCSHNGICDAEGRLRVLFIFDKEELKYDIANIAYAQGDVARVNDNYGHDLLGDDREHLMHQWKDVCEDGNYDRVMRIEMLALSEVEQALYKYSAKAIRKDWSLDDLMDTKQELLIELRVPYGFTDVTCWYLLRLIHEYIVDRVLADWASITYPEAEMRWMEKADITLAKIKEAKTMGKGGNAQYVKPSIL